MRLLRTLAHCLALTLALSGFQAMAQQSIGPSACCDVPLPESNQPATTPTTPPCGPTIYVVDNRGRLATVNVGTFDVKIIGSLGTILTDIGFDPKTHQLWGISFNSLYSVDKAGGHATFKASLTNSTGGRISDANALVFNSAGVPFVAGFQSDTLYTLNLTTGKATFLSHMAGYKSAGDLTFFNDLLVLTGFTGPSIGPTTKNYLVFMDPNTKFAVKGGGMPLASKDVFGLVSTGKNELFGFGDATTTLQPGLFGIDPRLYPKSFPDKLLKNLSAAGLGQIYGAAYDGNYQP